MKQFSSFISSVHFPFVFIFMYGLFLILSVRYVSVFASHTSQEYSVFSGRAGLDRVARIGDINVFISVQITCKCCLLCRQHVTHSFLSSHVVSDIGVDLSKVKEYVIVMIKSIGPFQTPLHSCAEPS